MCCTSCLEENLSLSKSLDNSIYALNDIKYSFLTFTKYFVVGLIIDDVFSMKIDKRKHVLYVDVGVYDYYLLNQEIGQTSQSCLTTGHRVSYTVTSQSVTSVCGDLDSAV